MQYLTDKEYTTITKKIIKYFTRRSQRLGKILINDRDLFHDIKYKIMKADWRWKPDGGRTQHSWRNQCGIFAIQEAIDDLKKKYTNMKDADFSLDYGGKDDSHKLLDSLESRDLRPVDILIEAEKQNKLKNELDTLIKVAELTETEIQYLRLWANGLKYKAIADTFGVKSQAVSSSIRRSLKKLKDTNG